jgi:predicted GNAT family acetyltransferase
MGAVRHNEAQHRYELDTEHGVAIAVYQQQGDSLVFVHTEVPPADEGKGIGAQIVRAALDDTRKRGFKIVPACSFVVAFVRRHPEYDDSRQGA